MLRLTSRGAAMVVGKRARPFARQMPSYSSSSGVLDETAASAEAEYRVQRLAYKQACRQLRGEFLLEHKQAIAASVEEHVRDNHGLDQGQAEKTVQIAPPVTKATRAGPPREGNEEIQTEQANRESVVVTQCKALLSEESPRWLTADDLPELKKHVDAMLALEQPYHEPYRDVLPKRAGRFPKR